MPTLPVNNRPPALIALPPAQHPANCVADLAGFQVDAGFPDAGPLRAGSRARGRATRSGVLGRRVCPERPRPIAGVAHGIDQTPDISVLADL